MRDPHVVHNAIGVRLGSDPRLRFYDSDTIGTVAQRTLLAIIDIARENGLAGRDRLGDLDTDALVARLADDDELATIPPVVAAAIIPIAIEIGSEEIAR